MLLLCIANLCMGQNKFMVIIKDAGSKEALSHATVRIAGTNNGATTNENGVALLTGIPDGISSFTFRYIGYKVYAVELTFPRASDTLTVFLEKEERQMDAVEISSTRSSRTIQNIPTRVEFINGEELEEKANMKPGDIRMLLNESTGIQTQQISATSANSGIRIQGLDGRYTQLLKDGFPLYAGFSGGLGLLQTPPLDLKQVEVIKGASSTLYGGGAISGLVNLISRTPEEEKELRLLGNVTSAGGLDISGFYSQTFDKTGLTILASRNSSAPYDPSQTGFTAIPKTERYVLNPKLFIYFSPRTELNFGVNGIIEDRIGGDIQFIKGKGDDIHRYFEKNKSKRLSSQFLLTHYFNKESGFSLKNSISYFNRKLSIPDYIFDGKQWSSYSEITFHDDEGKLDWVGGLNLYTDHFTEYPTDNFPARSYRQNTIGGFIQSTGEIADWLQTEMGLRGDYVIDYGFAFLPRLSVLFKISPQLTSRLGGGFGYKTPTIFTEETERIHLETVLPVSADKNQLERSYGVNFDINYRTSFFERLSLNVNQLFFYTRINHPLLLEDASPNAFQLINSNGYLDSKGWETNIKLAYADFKLFIGYTFTDAHIMKKGIKKENPLTARHRLNNVLMYEVEDQWKIGLEAYYYSKQFLNDGASSNPYWLFGFMVEKIWKRFSLYINFENFTDTRQTRFESIYNGTISHPEFKDIYAPLDGFVVNGGIKLNL